MIEPANRFFAPALAAIHALAFPATEAWSEHALTTQLKSPGGFGLVDPSGGFALARVIVDEAELLTIAVLPAMQRRGLARALLAGVAAEAARRGAKNVFLEVSERNAPARALYQSAGYLPVGRRPAYYPDGADALLLRLTLAS